MVWLDIAIVVVLLAAAFIGWRTGAISSLALAGGLAGGIALGGAYGESLGDAILGDKGYASFAGFAVVLVLALLAAFIVGKVVRKVLAMLWLGWLDRASGTGLALFAAVAIIATLLVIADAAPYVPNWAKNATSDSVIAPKIVQAGGFIRDLLPDNFRDWIPS